MKHASCQSGESEHDVCDNRPIAVPCAQRPVERRPARGPAGLRRPTRLEGQRLQIPVFREGTAERLSAPAEHGVGRTAGVAGPFAAVRAGDQNLGRITVKGPPNGGQVMSGWANHTEPIQGTRGRIGHAWMRQCQCPPNIPGAQGPLKRWHRRNRVERKSVPDSQNLSVTLVTPPPQYWGRPPKGTTWCLERGPSIARPTGEVSFYSYTLAGPRCIEHILSLI